MEPLTLHFEAPPGTDPEAVAAEIKASISGDDTTQVVEATPQRFQAIGAGEIIALIALLPSIPQGIAAMPKASGVASTDCRGRPPQRADRSAHV